MGKVYDDEDDETGFNEVTFLPNDIKLYHYETEVGTDCRIWQGSLHKGKYVRYIDAYHNRDYLHRVVARNKYGEIPYGHKVSWTCGNTRCINADHIVIVNQDLIVPTKRKLTNAQVEAIKKDTRPYRQIAKAYKVSYSSVAKIKIGERRLLSCDDDTVVNTAKDIGECANQLPI